jgi:hypothetical protein
MPIIEKTPALYAGQDPCRDENLNERLQLVGYHGDRIKERPLPQVKDLCNNQVREESKAEEDSYENEQPPANPQATRIEEYLSHVP